MVVQVKFLHTQLQCIVIYGCTLQLKAKKQLIFYSHLLLKYYFFVFFFPSPRQFRSLNSLLCRESSSSHHCQPTPEAQLSSAHSPTPRYRPTPHHRFVVANLGLLGLFLCYGLWGGWYRRCGLLVARFFFFWLSLRLP